MLFTCKNILIYITKLKRVTFCYVCAVLFVIFAGLTDIFNVYANTTDNVHIINNSFVGSIEIGQDGEVFNDRLFRFTGDGKCLVYDMETLSLSNSFYLDKINILKPHSNTVCFGKQYYAHDDVYPLIYCNIYNNYKNNTDRKLGTCCVYRLMDDTSQLVQIIRLGFTDNNDLWSDLEDNRPYGNFIVDCELNHLYVFTIRDINRTVRFFKMNLPDITEGDYDNEYGCNIVTLNDCDILSTFDIPYTYLIQGGCFYQGKVFSLEGDHSNGILRIVDVNEEKVLAEYPIHDFFTNSEPEMISQQKGVFFYSDVKGNVYKFSLSEEHVWDKGIVQVRPSYSTTGLVLYSCLYCEAHDYRIVPVVPKVFSYGNMYMY